MLQTMTQETANLIAQDRQLEQYDRRIGGNYLLASEGAYQGNAYSDGYGMSMEVLKRRREASKQLKAAYRERQLRFHEGMAAVLEGRLHPQVWLYKMRESQSIEDFPLLLGDAIDRSLMLGYAEAPTMYQMIAQVRQLRDFRVANQYAIDGGDGSFGEAIGRGQPYPEAQLTETKYTLQLEKFGRRMAFFWELIINDDLGAFNDIVRRFGRAARRSEQKAVTSKYAGNGTFFATGNGNLITTGLGASSSNPVLSAAGLQDGMKILARQVDAGGEPILIDAVTLVVPPALETVGLNILNSLTVESTEAGGTSNQKIIVQNWLRNRIRMAVDPYLPIIDATHGHTAWYLFADPNSGRPALQFATRRGATGPEMFLRSSNAIRVGAGMSDPLDGDFDHDSIDYKVRHCYGAATGDPKMAVTSNGSGS